MKDCELVTLISSLSCMIAKDKTIEEITLLAAIFTQLGDSLITTAVIREIEEEFGIKVKVIKKLYEIKSEKFNQLEIFYLCEYISGTFGTGTGPEFSNDPKHIDSGKYLPEIIPQDKIKDILLFPQNVAKMFLEDLENKKL